MPSKTAGKRNVFSLSVNSKSKSFPSPPFFAKKGENLFFLGKQRDANSFGNFIRHFFFFPKIFPLGPKIKGFKFCTGKPEEDTKGLHVDFVYPPKSFFPSSSLKKKLGQRCYFSPRKYFGFPRKRAEWKKRRGVKNNLVFSRRRNKTIKVAPERNGIFLFFLHLTQPFSQIIISQDIEIKAPPPFPVR